MFFRVQRNDYLDFLQHPNVNSWSYEHQNYEDSIEENIYPRRARSAGSGGGLHFLVSFLKNDIDHLCTPSIYGVKVVLSNPASYPGLVEDHYFRISMNRDVVVGIKPRLMTTSDQLRNYDVQYRQCYFSTERQLRYFNVYTQENCNLEYLTNFTLKKCGCVEFYMPRKLFYNYNVNYHFYIQFFNRLTFLFMDVLDTKD
ncbi:hypothetical protein C0J52_07055 [Blattella germanica]|nr:hypothetical protein C0J52_07055 [Blattella germanica]